MWSWLRCYPFFCFVAFVCRDWQRRKKKNERKDERRNKHYCTHRKEEEEEKEQMFFISRKTFVIGSHGVSSMLSIVQLNTFNNIIQCFVKGLGSDLIFVRMMRMFNREKRWMGFNSDTWNNIRFVANMHDILTHEFFKCLNLILLGEIIGITNMIMKMCRWSGCHRSRSWVALFMDRGGWWWWYSW